MEYSLWIFNQQTTPHQLQTRPIVFIKFTTIPKKCLLQQSRCVWDFFFNEYSLQVLCPQTRSELHNGCQIQKLIHKNKTEKNKHAHINKRFYEDQHKQCSIWNMILETLIVINTGRPYAFVVILNIFLFVRVIRQSFHADPASCLPAIRLVPNQFLSVFLNFPLQQSSARSLPPSWAQHVFSDCPNPHPS